jgi:predicted 3-demethylubiquinone-9 3-methyltransferase (glyoxalase superfamily)
MQKIKACLWFDGRVDEAVKFYTSIFKNSKKKKMAYYGEAGPQERISDDGHFRDRRSGIHDMEWRPHVYVQ